MASSPTETVTTSIPSPSLHLGGDAGDGSRGPVSDLGTLDRVESPSAESSISQPTVFGSSPPSQYTNHLDPSHTGLGSYSSKLTPPQEQNEWNKAPATNSRSRSNSATRYYSHARERSGTVNSTNGVPTNPSQDNTYQLSSPNTIQAQRSFTNLANLNTNTAPNPPMGASPPQGPAPAYTSNQQPSVYSPQPPMQQSFQPDVNHLGANINQGQDPSALTMVTPLENLGADAALVDCPRCQTSTRTTTTKEAGDAVTLWAVVLCCISGALLAWIPCVIKDCKDTVHRCSQCQLLLATVTSSGAVRVAQGINKPVASQYGHQPQMSMRDPYNQARDAGPAPAYNSVWKAEDQQQQPEQPQQQYAQQVQTPVAEMEATEIEPVELPAAAGPGWYGESSKSPTVEANNALHLEEKGPSPSAQVKETKS